MTRIVLCCVVLLVCGAENVLRTHTSAHQSSLLRAGHRSFLVTGDCYRRDEIDATHYPTFHQMEGVRVWDAPAGAHHPATSAEALASPPTDPHSQAVVADLKHTLEGLVRHLFGANTPHRWVDAYFPFTQPSLELEVHFGGRWLECLGCGAIHRALLQQCGLPAHQYGWAFGMGLERLAMVLYDIPDIRLFWSDDPRFLSQFASAATSTTPIKFKPFSSYSPVIKDVSFWLPPAEASAAAAATTTAATATATAPFHDNDLYSVVRDVAGDLVESVALVDSFVHPKTKRPSRCYRITYRHLSRMLTNAEVDVLQATVRERLKARPDIELR
jgi:phenylalanyl-tRNA synthetase alpha chain